MCSPTPASAQRQGAVGGALVSPLLYMQSHPKGKTTSNLFLMPSTAPCKPVPAVNLASNSNPTYCIYIYTKMQKDNTYTYVYRTGASFVLWMSAFTCARCCLGLCVADFVDRTRMSADVCGLGTSTRMQAHRLQAWSPAPRSPHRDLRIFMVLCLLCLGPLEYVLPCRRLRQSTWPCKAAASSGVAPSSICASFA